jgi:hypothetical protein
MFLVIGNSGNTDWHVAASAGKLQVLQNLWKWARKKLTEEINKHVYCSLAIGETPPGTWQQVQAKFRFCRNCGIELKN